MPTYKQPLIHAYNVNPPMNILVIKISSVGDVVMVTASLKALRNKFPKAKIHCLVGKESHSILRNCPYLDGIIVYDKKHQDRGFFKFLKFARKLKRYQFDTVVDFQNNKKSHIFSFLSSAKKSFGFNNGKYSFLLSHAINNYDKEIPAIQQQFQILNQLDIQYDSNTYLELWPSNEDREYAARLLATNQIGIENSIVGINIGASAEWRTKNWPIEYIAKLCDLLSTNDIRVIITGMDKDKSDAEELLSLSQSKPIILVGKTNIMQLAALIEKCKVFISPDSAPMHIASAVGTPFIALFGPTSSVRHIPPAKKFIILDRNLSCSPCYSKNCSISTHACLNDILPSEVYVAIERLMAE